ncbi:Molybdate/tungstate transport system permease protein WtpB [Thermoplasmatales archaeon]|nr:Molybdate/tungstate transport system permease protein WtpB [Thermoplasmatales archaeon]
MEMKKNSFKGSPDAVSIISWITVALLVIPILFILYFGFVVYRNALGFSSTVFESIELTVISSAISAFTVFVVFTPLAFNLARKQSNAMETATDIPASIPHPIVGIAFLILGSPITPFGRFLASIGINFFDSIQGLIVVLSFISAPVYIRSAQSVFSSLNRYHEMFGYSLGASRLRVLYSVVIPGCIKDLTSAALTSMSRAMSEFGSIAILVYYILQGPFKGVEPASVLIYQYYGYYGPGVAVTAAALMIIVSMIILGITRILKSGKLLGRGVT